MSRVFSSSQSLRSNQTKKTSEPNREAFQKALRAKTQSISPSSLNLLKRGREEKVKRSKEPLEKNEESKKKKEDPIEGAPSPFTLFSSSAQSGESTIPLRAVSTQELGELLGTLSKSITELELSDLKNTSFTFESQNPLSSLNGLKLEIDYYNTSPASIYVKLLGTAQGVALLTKHTSALLASLESRFPSYEFHIKKGLINPLEEKKEKKSLNAPLAKVGDKK